MDWGFLNRLAFPLLFSFASQLAVYFPRANRKETALSKASRSARLLCGSQVSPPECTAGGAEPLEPYTWLQINWFTGWHGWGGGGEAGGEASGPQK